MAKKAIKKNNTIGFPKWAFYLSIFAFIGLATVALTSAAPGGGKGGKSGDSGSNVYYFADASRINLPADGSIQLEDAQLSLGGLFSGNVKVGRMSEGSEFKFGGKGGGVDNPLDYTLQETCYIVSATTSDAVLSVNNGGNYEEVSVRKAPDGSGGNWQEACVSPPRKGGQPSYDVRHVSGGEVLFYEMQKTYSANY